MTAPHTNAVAQGIHLARHPIAGEGGHVCAPACLALHGRSSLLRLDSTNSTPGVPTASGGFSPHIWGA